jgi:hypothetical protein
MSKRKESEDQTNLTSSIEKNIFLQTDLSILTSKGSVPLISAIIMKFLTITKMELKSID